MKTYILTVFVVFVSVAASSKDYNPCKNVKHGDEKYLKEDPRDCSKYYVCQQDQIADRKDCAYGLSFDPNMVNVDPPCNYPDPDWVPECKIEDNDELRDLKC